MFDAKHTLKFYYDHKHLLLSLLYVYSKIMYWVNSAMSLYERTGIFLSPHFSLIYILERFPALVEKADLCFTVIAFESRNLQGIKKP